MSASRTDQTRPVRGESDPAAPFCDDTNFTHKAAAAGNAGRPDDMPGAVAFLASDDAGYITGQTLSVSGGLTMAG